MTQENVNSNALQIHVIKYTSCDPLVCSSMKGRFDIIVEAWENFTIRGLTYFEKNGARWVAFPSKKIEDMWIPLFEWSDSKTMRAFTEETLKALDQYLSVH